MPNLPIVNLSQAHFDRVVAAFPGDTGEEKTLSYQHWLVNNLIDFVEQREIAQLQMQHQQALNEAMDNIRESVPPRVPFPPEGIEM